MNKISFRPLNIDDTKLIFENREFIVSYFNGGISKKDFNSWKFEDEVKYTEREIEDVKNGRKSSFLIFIGLTHLATFFVKTPYFFVDVL